MGLRSYNGSWVYCTHIPSLAYLNKVNATEIWTPGVPRPRFSAQYSGFSPVTATPKATRAGAGTIGLLSIHLLLQKKKEKKKTKSDPES